ncbi:hypothetical protein C7999DRAFT_44394 [Corynascus novoguineensis]|uniref:Uncharacterized protein n=1 Tax=Corynascus novoguineensis TaxID=1126955 RepID=A0AAN7CNA8_9PEZI|nr:hypothetical protein C7999DRAFT_44394 [Corynascus novoguineensis]
MDRDASSATNLLERKNILIADILTSVRDYFNLALAPVDDTASAGQTAERSLAMETKLSAVIKSTEDLVSLSRRIRELWIIGALKPVTGEVDHNMDLDSEQVFSLLNTLRDRQRQNMLQHAAAAGGGFTYEVAGHEGHEGQIEPISEPK